MKYKTPYNKDMTEQIIETGKKLYDRNLTVSTSGNISVKTEKGIYITATGKSLGNLKREDIVLTDYEGNELSSGKASSEKKLHTEIYKIRPDVKAIIHSHPVYLTTFAVCNKPLDEPLMSENILYFEDIPAAPYFMPSSEALATETAKYFKDRDVVIMSNHGVTVAAETLQKAFEKLETAEFYAHISLNTKILGTPKYLSKEQIEELKLLKGNKI